MNRFASKSVAVLSAATLLFTVVGCSNKNKTAKNNTGGNLTDVAPPAPAHQSVAYQPAPYQPYQGQPAQSVTPVNYEPAPVEPAVTTPAATAAGKKYTVQKGDTLWSIAQRTYGDGKQYRKIVQANPTIKGERVMVGQTIMLP